MTPLVPIFRPLQNYSEAVRQGKKKGKNKRKMMKKRQRNEEKEAWNEKIWQSCNLWILKYAGITGTAFLKRDKNKGSMV